MSSSDLEKKNKKEKKGKKHPMKSINQSDLGSVGTFSIEVNEPNSVGLQTKGNNVKNLAPRKTSLRKTDDLNVNISTVELQQPPEKQAKEVDNNSVVKNVPFRTEQEDPEDSSSSSGSETSGSGKEQSQDDDANGKEKANQPNKEDREIHHEASLKAAKYKQKYESLKEEHKELQAELSKKRKDIQWLETIKEKLEDKLSELSDKYSVLQSVHTDMCVDLTFLLNLPPASNQHVISSALGKALMYGPLNTAAGKSHRSLSQSQFSSSHAESSNQGDDSDDLDDDVDDEDKEGRGRTQTTQRKLNFLYDTPKATLFGDFEEGNQEKRRRTTDGCEDKGKLPREGRALGEIKKALKESLNDRKFSISMPSTDMRSWVTTFVQTCRSFKCTDEELLNLFKLMVDNSSTHTTLGFLSAPIAQTWNTLYPYLRRMCKIPEPQEALTALTLCRQGTMSIAEFYAVFRTLLLDCGEGNIPDDQQIHHFIQGLTDVSLRRRCLAWEKKQRRGGIPPNLEDAHVFALEAEELDNKAKGSKRRDGITTPRLIVNQITHQPYDVLSDGYDMYGNDDMETEAPMQVVNAIHSSPYHQPPTSAGSMGYPPRPHGYGLPPTGTSSFQSHSSPSYANVSSSSSSSSAVASSASAHGNNTKALPPWHCTSEWVESNLFCDSRKRPTKGSKMWDKNLAMDFQYLKVHCWSHNKGVGPTARRFKSGLPFLTVVDNNTVCSDCGAQADHITAECRYRPSSQWFLYFGNEYNVAPAQVEMAPPPPNYWKDTGIGEKRKNGDHSRKNKKNKA